MKIKKILLISLLSFFLTNNIVYAKETVNDFLFSLVNSVDRYSNDNSLNQNDKEILFLKLFKSSFDIPRIGKFVLGKYWKKATKEQQKEFLNLFSAVTVKTFSPLLSRIKLKEFTIIKVESLNSKEFLVYSNLKINKKSPIIIIWQIYKNNNNRFKILDIQAEGISFIVTLRSDYSSYIFREGSIENLLITLRNRLKNIKIDPGR